ncbi:hypothetical protein M2480_000101 [Parabacteroides sp. PFB2-12]|uniref:ATP-binding protein n=1 Tax=unclassified Parabacteroides TaxID=2649774 RepID=UPI002475AFD6|nr:MULTISPECIES: AAA family ATPase [unclassified Parabacteroides]MDH6341349.1 hypothetical protein [Parabacteroides sp. PM6-13]MDH6389143.1 hypothetical protein [Parabacteroides sp. PFB2-12]
MVIKALNSQNPFSDYGQIVKGSRFAGRKNEVQTIQNRILGDAYGNIAIMGMPRIGKSSLVWNALMPLKEKLLNKRNILSFIYVGRLVSSKDFFKQLACQVLEELELIESHESSFNKLQPIYDKMKAEKDNFEFKNLVQKFFRFLKRNEFRASFILDEFDHVASIFTVSDFQLLRELASQPETQICLVTVSRRTIQEIEAENGAISNFCGIFSDLRLGLFNNSDIAEYWDSLKRLDIEVSDEYKQNIDYLVGRHPFLIDMCNYEVYNLMLKNQVVKFDFEPSYLESELKLALFNNFDKIIILLKDEKLYDKALQLILGPIYNVTISDEQKLLKYEFIRKVGSMKKYSLLKREFNNSKNQNSASYVCFSDYFTELLYLKYNDIDFWPLWKETERAVRDLIKTWITEVFDDDWETKYLTKYAKSGGKYDGIKKLCNTRTYSNKKFGNSSEHLIDYTFPRDMYDLFISSDWDWFKKVLGDEKKEWGKKFNFLADIRNPVAHNNSEFISIDDFNTAKKYCETIIERVTKWRNNY